MRTWKMFLHLIRAGVPPISGSSYSWAMGGAGKSEIIGMIRETARHFFGEDGELCMASSNSAARGVGGDTIHSSMHWHGKAGSHWTS